MQAGFPDRQRPGIESSLRLRRESRPRKTQNPQRRLCLLAARTETQRMRKVGPQLQLRIVKTRPIKEPTFSGRPTSLPLY